MAWRYVAGGVALLALTGAATPRPASVGPTPVDYTVAPVFSEGRLTALQVEVRLQGDASGEAVLELPDDNDDGHPHLSQLQVDGAELSRDGPDRRRLRFRPGAALTVRYRLLPGGDKDPEGESRAPIIRPTWFAVHGASALVLPQGRAGAPARLHLSGAPAGWTLSSNLQDRVTTLAKVQDSMLVGGDHYREISRTVDGARLRLAFPATFAARASAALDDIARVDVAERAFWRTKGEPFFVAVVPITDDVDYSGRGLDGGFVLYLGKDAPKDAWLHLLAHEHMHAWISRRIGGFPETDSDLEAWLNEGFTEAFKARVLLSAGLWTPEQFVADQNASLLRYGVSPVKTAPNSRIGADRHRDFDVNKLPYDRGRLLALLWDGKLRRRTGGRLGLEDVMRAQVAAAGRAGLGRDRRLSADRLFPVVVRRLTGVDLTGDLRRYVDEGQAIDLPPDTFGRCATVVRVTQPDFDRGFDMDATLKAHNRVAGLEPQGPAARAGLREGDHIAIDEIPGHDSQAMLTYQVREPGGGRHTVRYKPEGRGQVTFQQVRLGAWPAGHAAPCRKGLTRP